MQKSVTFQYINKRNQEINPVHNNYKTIKYLEVNVAKEVAVH
jgi:hypothetical protein